MLAAIERAFSNDPERARQNDAFQATTRENAFREEVFRLRLARTEVDVLQHGALRKGLFSELAQRCWGREGLETRV